MVYGSVRKLVVVVLSLLLVLSDNTLHAKTASRSVEMQHVSYLVKLFTLNGSPDKQLQKYLRENPTNTINFHYPTRKELYSLLYHSEESPYKNYKVVDTAVDIGNSYKSHSWVNSDMIQGKVLRLLHHEPPNFVLEVGSFVGSGSIHTLAPLVSRSESNKGIVLCIDTWLGDVNMRINPYFDKFTSPRHGTPQLYDIFLSNVVSNELHEVVYPLSLPSVVAARMLGRFRWKIDVIYIDSAHELGETLVELILYYQLLRPGGVLVGDDYSSFPGVKHDVDLFAKYLGIRPYIIKGQWFLVKSNDNQLF